MFTAFDNRRGVGLVRKQWFRKAKVVVLGRNFPGDGLQNLLDPRMGDALSRHMGGRP
jgi:hypothetical protein